MLRAVFPEAIERQGPSEGSAFPSREQAELVRRFRENRGLGLQFHIDIARFNVPAIRAWLDNELVLARRAQSEAQRDWMRASSRLRGDVPMEARELTRLQQFILQADDRVRRIEGFDRDWNSLEPDFRRWASAQAEVSIGGKVGW